MLEILSSKYFWIIVLVGGLIGAVLALVIPTDYDRFEKSEMGFICPPSEFKYRVPCLEIINDSADIKDYLRLVNGLTDSAAFPGTAVEIGKEVGVYSSLGKYGISQIIVINDNSKFGNRSIYKCWVTDAFLSQKPCDEKKNKTVPNTK